MNYSELTKEQLYKLLETREEGLKTKEVEERISKYGQNVLSTEKQKSNLAMFFSEFKDLMIIILIASSIISFILSYINKESYIDSIIIIAIVLLNAILGFLQEKKADKAIDSLKKIQKTKVKVRRNNKIYVIDSDYIVKGDIILLEAGDIVCADARIIKSTALKIDESSLTGESFPVEKTEEIIKNNNDNTNIIFSGTNVVYGKCEAIVYETGKNTQFGKIAESLNESEIETTPLQKRINEISKFLSFLISIIILCMLVLGIIKGIKLKEIIMLSISLAVAAIPEGLPAIITIILSIGMTELAKKKAIVRKLSSVETLGSTEVICSDKTGTITKNQMVVREIYFDGKIQNVSEIDQNNALFKGMILNNDSSKNESEYIGDSTEIALIKCLEEIVNVEEIKKNQKRIDEIPFDSERKMMSTINKDNDKINIYTKGSFDSVIERCKYIFENNRVLKLTKKKKDELIKIENEESNKAYRVLAFAYKSLEKDYISNDLESDLIFVGMTCMIDPPRDDIKESIELCKMAGIKPIMITGDSLCTAKAIAREIGILEDDSAAIVGTELDKLNFDDLKEKVLDYSVYARVSPINKLDIVKAIKENQKLVAMTGDGVNDAPALKSADIGVGMGITGTEVSKNVSDIVLSDDSFSSIVTAIGEGRRIFDNIRNVLVYLLTGNITEVLIVFIGMLFGIEIFFPIQLLYINLITDSIPAISLAFEKEEKNIMKRKIRNLNDTFFTPFLISKICISSILKTISIMLIYIINLRLYDVNIATTSAFLTLILLEIIYSYNCRNLKQTIINKNIFDNKVLNRSILISLIMQIIIFTTPIKQIFKISSLNVEQVCSCILVVIVIFIINELLKKIQTRIFKD